MVGVDGVELLLDAVGGLGLGELAVLVGVPLVEYVLGAIGGSLLAGPEFGGRELPVAVFVERLERGGCRGDLVFGDDAVVVGIDGGERTQSMRVASPERCGRPLGPACVEAEARISSGMSLPSRFVSARVKRPWRRSGTSSLVRVPSPSLSRDMRRWTVSSGLLAAGSTSTRRVIDAGRQLAVVVGVE